MFCTVFNECYACPGTKLAPPILDERVDGLTPEEALEATATLTSQQYPPALLTTLALLGDVFPPEWPPPRSADSKAPRLEAPPQLQLRATLAGGIEPSKTEFATLVNVACVSSNDVVQVLVSSASILVEITVRSPQKKIACII